jgi:pimeloyl-ACP methyl ester carboxylesterase
MWMPRNVMLLVKRRLHNEHQYAAHLFGYPSLHGGLDENADSLASYLADREYASVHLVAHSLGGVVALRALTLHPDAPVERVVCLGSPLCGSNPASELGHTNWGRRLLGRSVSDGVIDTAASQWAHEVCDTHEIGVIAGTVPVGLGRLAASFDGENDGTVAVSETRLPGARDHLCMAVNHMGLVTSRDVATQVAAFLKRGEFLREDGKPEPIPSTDS